MALYKEDIIDIELESGSIHRNWMNHAIGLGDVKANRFGVRIFRNGEAVNIGSGTCQGFFMRPDGTNLQIQGSTYTGVDGNLAWVQLPQDAYAFQGQFCLAIKLIGGGITGTMRIIDGMVDNTGTTGAVTPTSTVPTSQEIIAAYNNAVAVIDNSVRYDIDQSLTAAQKKRARNNIEAASESDVSALQENLFDEDNLTDNYAVSDITGELVAAEGFACTDYIKVEPYDVIGVPASFGANLAVCVLYDSDKHFISKSIFIGTETRQYFGTLRAVVAEMDAAYARFNIVPNAWYPYEKQYIWVIKSGAENLYDTTKRIVDITNFFEAGNLTANSLITDNGDIGTYNGYAVTDYIPVSMGDKVTVAYANGTLFPLGAFYDSSKNLISVRKSNNTTSGPESIYIPDQQIAYIRVNITNQSILSYQNQYVIVEKNGELIENYFYLDSLERKIYVGPNRTNGFTTLKSCCEYIQKNDIKNAIVIVDPGKYDLVSEFGSTYLDGVTHNYPTGLMIGNNTHFIFREGAEVVFNYTGSNAKIADYFSPFNVYGDFVLENAHITVSNARYCVHEDIRTLSPLGFAIPDSYSGKYINCTMVHNGHTIGTYDAHCCIGASTHPNGLSVIDGGYYNSSESMEIDILYHNYEIAHSGDHPSEVIIRDVYAENGFLLAGTTTSDATVYINGCHTGEPLEINDPNHHFTVKEW